VVECQPSRLWWFSPSPRSDQNLPCATRLHQLHSNSASPVITRSTYPGLTPLPRCCCTTLRRSNPLLGPKVTLIDNSSRCSRFAFKIPSNTRPGASISVSLNRKMPVVNLPVQPAHSISLGPIPLGRVQFFLTLAAAFVGFIALLTLAVSLSRDYKTSSRPVLVDVRALPTTGKQPCLSKQSRGCNAGRVIMSVSRPSEIPPFKSRGNLNEESFNSSRSLSQRPSSREKLREQPDVMKGDAGEMQNFKSRPSLPLTPPGLSTAFFSFQDRRLSVAASSNGDFDPRLAHGPNSDLSSSESTMSLVHDAQVPSPISLRKSYTKAHPHDPIQSSSPIGTGSEDSSSAFSPSSFPSSHPILPLAPHAALESKEMDVTGEIVSVLDDSGADWKRHTRVFGGGVCLACMAAGGNDGGFYGDNVPLDQRR
jgi:hypothetical protein